MATFESHLATDAAIFVDPDEFGEAVTIKPVDQSADISCNATKQQLVGAADEKDEANFIFRTADYPSPTEGDYIISEASRQWTVTKATDRNGMQEVQAFAPVEKN